MRALAPRTIDLGPGTTDITNSRWLGGPLDVRFPPMNLIHQNSRRVGNQAAVWMPRSGTTENHDEMADATDRTTFSPPSLYAASQGSTAPLAQVPLVQGQVEMGDKRYASLVELPSRFDSRFIPKNVRKCEIALPTLSHSCDGSAL